MYANTNTIWTNPTDKKTTDIFRNLKNPNKYIEVVRYKCGHFYVRQFMHWDNGVTNYLGTKRGGHFRMTARTLCPILADYKLIMTEYRA